MANKSRLLFLLKYLLENTDENTLVSSVKLRDILEAEGFKADNRTVRDDMEMLKAAGMDVLIRDRNGLPTRYAMGQRAWSTAELKIMIDALSACQFIQPAQCTSMINRLISEAPVSERASLTPDLYMSGDRGVDTVHLTEVLQTVNECKRLGRKMEFRYFTYDLRKEKVFKNRGERYFVSPYATIWKEDRYYLVGYSDKHEKVITFRIDRIAAPEVSEDAALPADKSFTVSRYVGQVFHMYDGEEKEVVLHCKRERMDQIIDRFGRYVKVENITADSFDVRAKVSVSPTFFAWLFQYAGEISVIGPADVKEAYLLRLGQAIEQHE